MHMLQKAGYVSSIRKEREELLGGGGGGGGGGNEEGEGVQREVERLHFIHNSL